MSICTQESVLTKCCKNSAAVIVPAAPPSWPIFLMSATSLLIYSLYKSGSEQKSSEQTSKIEINVPARKNQFTIRKKWLLEKLEDETYLNDIYMEAKEIFFKAAEKYSVATSK